jgi:hypothetical protein
MGNLMQYKKTIILSLLFFIFFSGCIKQNGTSNSRNNNVQYNLIKPGNGIYAIVEKNVTEEKTKNNSFEKKYFNEGKIIKIERYNTKGKLTDDFFVPAITKFEYDSDNHVKFVKYYNKKNHKAIDNNFGYWSIEYIYDNENRVVMEIYRDAESKFLEVPRNINGEIVKKDFLAPVLTYEYLDDKLRIKALDKNFNLLKEVVGDKPCVPFIDCGEND